MNNQVITQERIDTLVSQVATVGTMEAKEVKTVAILHSDININLSDYGRRSVTDITSLKDSIRQNGLTSPIYVKELEGKFEVFEGVRRMTAINELIEDEGFYLTEIPCIVLN